MSNLIGNIEKSSKEQLSGIEQINSAINQLDSQTQQNAQIAHQAHDIAVMTDKIAKLVVSNANAKEFIGKNEVKAKDIDIKSNVSQKTEKKEIIKNQAKIEKKIEPKTVQAKSNNEEWESF